MVPEKQLHESIQRPTRRNTPAAPATGLLLAVLIGSVGGCQDGPLYALKTINPYFTMREWKQDQKLGVTDHERHRDLRALALQIDSMSTNEQAKWLQHLDRIFENDPNPEMRRLAVVAAGKTAVPGSLELVERGLDDESIKVQMESCRALGTRSEPEAAQLLASTLGTTAELDVKHSAIAALGNHQGRIPLNSLRIVLDEQDPATLDLVMNSLRGVTGKDFGEDPQQWIAAIDQMTPESQTEPAEDRPGSPMSDPGTIRYAQGEGNSIR
jgi:hypothetical protein